MTEVTAIISPPPRFSRSPTPRPMKKGAHQVITVHRRWPAAWGAILGGRGKKRQGAVGDLLDEAGAALWNPRASGGAAGLPSASSTGAGDRLPQESADLGQTLVLDERSASERHQDQLAGPGVEVTLKLLGDMLGWTERGPALDDV